MVTCPRSHSGTLPTHVVGRGPALVCSVSNPKRAPQCPQGARIRSRHVLMVTMLRVWKLRLRRGSGHSDIKVWPLSFCPAAPEYLVIPLASLSPRCYLWSKCTFP